MGSERLPGKVLKSLVFVPMIERIVTRLQRCKTTQNIILATTDLQRDDILVEFANRLNIKIFRGSEKDVLDRYYQCAIKFGLQTIIRATGDNPFVDPEEIDNLVIFVQKNDLQYACSFPSQGCPLPIGIGAEVFKVSALEKSWRETTQAYQREHVNEYIHENPSLFCQKDFNVPLSKQAPELSFTVDTREQFSDAEAVIKSAQGAVGEDAFISTEWLISYAEGRFN